MMRQYFIAAVLVVSACRLDPGTPDYSSHVGLIDEVEDNPDELPGPNPYEPGDARLALGQFYEGGRSEEIVINGTTTNYFIFVIDGTTQLTYSQETSTDRVEGRVADKLEHAGLSFWGGGLVWTEGIDLTGWTTMYVSFKSSDPTFETFDITLQSGDNAASTVLDPRDYGYTNDGEWHSLEVPLQDAIDAGFDITNVRSPFIIGGAGGMGGDELLVDDLYYTD